MSTNKYTPEQHITAFWSKVAITANDEQCWLWIASTADGYGIKAWNGSNQLAHRISWELKYGAIPDDLCVLHSCDVRNCVNPKHLFLGTNQDNVDDRERKGRGKVPRSKKST